MVELKNSRRIFNKLFMDATDSYYMITSLFCLLRMTAIVFLLMGSFDYSILNFEV